MFNISAKLATEIQSSLVTIKNANGADKEQTIKSAIERINSNLAAAGSKKFASFRTKQIKAILDTLPPEQSETIQKVQAHMRSATENKNKLLKLVIQNQETWPAEVEIIANALSASSVRELLKQVTQEKSKIHPQEHARFFKLLVGKLPSLSADLAIRILSKYKDNMSDADPPQEIIKAVLEKCPQLTSSQANKIYDITTSSLLVDEGLLTSFQNKMSKKTTHALIKQLTKSNISGINAKNYIIPLIEKQKGVPLDTTFKLIEKLKDSDIEIYKAILSSSAPPSQSRFEKVIETIRNLALSSVDVALVPTERGKLTTAILETLTQEARLAFLKIASKGSLPEHLVKSFILPTIISLEEVPKELAIDILKKIGQELDPSADLSAQLLQNLLPKTQGITLDKCLENLSESPQTRDLIWKKYITLTGSKNV